MFNEEKLSRLSPKEQIAELKQFFINMMDWTEQSHAEDIYIMLHDYLVTNIEKKFN